MTDQTPRLCLPMIDPGQSQKEMTHNEALALIDGAVQPAVRGVGIDAPPATAAPGDQWILGSQPSGAWAGQPLALATWTAGGWRFVPAANGMAAWSLADRLPVRFDAGRWVLGDIAAARLVIGGVAVVGPQRVAIPAPAGGGVIDGEARGAIAAILAALAGHGPIANS